MKTFLAVLGAFVLVLLFAAAVGVLIGALWPIDDEHERGG